MGRYKEGPEMLTDIVLGQYFPGNSFIHRLDPRTKIIITIVLIGSIFLATNYQGYAIMGAFCLLSIMIARIPLMLVIKSIRPLWIILLLTAVIHVFMTPGIVYFSIGPIQATEEGLRQGAFMGARLVFLIVMSSLLTFTTSPIALTDGIERILGPFRRFGLPAHELAMMMTIALRFIPTLLEETDRIMKAQMARGANFGSGNIFKRAQGMIPLLVPLFVSAFRRADELATAMEARCYRGGKGRTRMNELAMKIIDAGAFLATLAFILLLYKLGQA